MQNIYSYKAVEKFIEEKLIPAGYEIELIPGALVDSYVCIAPDENHYNFIFRETYINEWSSIFRLFKQLFNKNKFNCIICFIQ